MNNDLLLQTCYPLPGIGRHFPAIPARDSRQLLQPSSACLCLLTFSAPVVQAAVMAIAEKSRALCISN
jgi:hypothetical protein